MRQAQTPTACKMAPNLPYFVKKLSSDLSDFLAAHFPQVLFHVHPRSHGVPPELHSSFTPV
jgi:hypothetical protein